MLNGIILALGLAIIGIIVKHLHKHHGPGSKH